MTKPHHWTTVAGQVTAHPAAFLIVLAYGIAWFVFEHERFDFHAVATLVVWAMTLFIQRADHRDTQAIHAKLDELLLAVGDADNAVSDVDDLEPEQIEEKRSAQKAARPRA